MRLLRLAVEIQRWDLAAHTIVLASARVLKDGDGLHGRKTKTKKKRAELYPRLVDILKTSGSAAESSLTPPAWASR